MMRKIVLAVFTTALIVALGNAFLKSADELTVPGPAPQSPTLEPTADLTAPTRRSEPMPRALTITVSGSVTGSGRKGLAADVEVFEFPRGFGCRPRLVGAFRSDDRGRYSGRVEVESRDSLLQARAHAKRHISSALASHPLELLKGTASWSSIDSEVVALDPLRLEAGRPIDVHLAGDVPARFQGRLKIGSSFDTTFVDWSDSRSLRTFVRSSHVISPSIPGFFSPRIRAAEVLGPSDQGGLAGSWTFELQRGRDVQGRLVDPQGLPLPGGRVFVHDAPARGSERNAYGWAKQQWMITDEDGRFTVRGAPEDAALAFRVEHPTHVCNWRRRGRLAEVELVGTPGRVLLVEFEVPPAPAGSSSTLPALFEADIPGQFVAFRREGRRYRSTPIDPLASQLTIEFPGYRPLTLTWDRDVGELDLGRVPLVRGVETTVTVVSGGEPVPGATVSMTVDLLYPFPRQESRSSETSRRGVAHFKGLPQGVGTLLVRADGFTDERVSFESIPRRVEVSISPLARLRARLVTATGIDPVIAVFTLSEGEDQSVETSADAEGAAAVTWWIDPGPERTLDLHVLDHLPVRFRLPALRSGEEFDLGTVTLPEGGRVEVIVRDESGALLEEAEVDLELDSHWVPFHFDVIPGGFRTTNAEGCAVFRGLIEGVARLVVRHPRAFREDRRQLALASSGLQVVEVTLPLGEDVRLLVEHADGSVPKYLEATLNEHGTGTTRELKAYNGVLGLRGVAPGPVTLIVGGQSITASSASELPETIVLDDAVTVTVGVEDDELLLQAVAEYVLIGERGRDSGTGVVENGQVVFDRVLPLRGTFKLWIAGGGQHQREVDLTRGSDSWTVTAIGRELHTPRTVVVVGSDGAPIAGASLGLGQGGSNRLSDANGSIRISAPPEVSAWVHAPGMCSWKGTLRFDGGDTARVVLEEECLLQCVVSGHDGRVPFHLEVHSHETEVTQIRHSDDGREFHLPPGVYSVRLRDISGLIDECVVHVTPGKTNRADLRTPPSFAVSGRAVMLPGRVVPRLQLRYAEPGGEGARRVDLGMEGQFTFKILRPGRYSFECPGAAPIVRDLQPGRSIDLVFSSASVRGDVVDTTGRKLPGCVFELERGGQSYRGVTDALGEFTLEHLPEGRYGVRFLVEADVRESWAVGSECQIGSGGEDQVVRLVRPAFGRVRVQLPRDREWRLGTWSDEGWFREIGRVSGPSVEVSVPTGRRAIYAVSEERAAIATVDVGTELSVVELWPQPFGRLTLRRPTGRDASVGWELFVTALVGEFSMPPVKTEIEESATLLLLPGTYRVTASGGEGEIAEIEVAVGAGETTEAVLAP